FRGMILPVLRMEVSESGLRTVKLAPIHVEVISPHGNVTLVRNLNPGALLERHGPEGVHTMVRSNCLHWVVEHVILCVAQTIKVPNRRLDGGIVVSVPVDSDHNVAKMVLVVSRDGRP